MAYTSDRTGAEIDATLDNADTHIATTTGNPHSVSASDVGLGSVDNTADADKPISTATQAALDAKADEPSTTNAIDAAEQEALEEVVMIAVSDETTDLTTGDGKAKFRMPFAIALSEIRASVNTAPAGSTIIIDVEVDIDESSGGTILSTLLTIDAGEKTSTTAATPAVISNPNIPDDSEVTINIDQVGSGTAGAGLKLTFKGKRVA